MGELFRVGSDFGNERQHTENLSIPAAPQGEDSSSTVPVALTAALDFWAMTGHICYQVWFWVWGWWTTLLSFSTVLAKEDDPF